MFILKNPEGGAYVPSKGVIVAEATYMHEVYRDVIRYVIDVITYLHRNELCTSKFDINNLVMVDD